VNSATAFDQLTQAIFTPLPLSLKGRNHSHSGKRKVIVLAGPTAVGKTKLSLHIAQQLGGEIISADSMQIYRGMDIGTAKVSIKDRALIPHHLIDSREINEKSNVVEFYHEAMQALNEIFSMHHVPLIVGGTGFYIHTLLYGPPSGPSSSPRVRAELENEMKNQGLEALYHRLSSLDPEYAATITRRDAHKIIRALEIITLSDRKVSDFVKNFRESSYDFRCWFLYLPTDILYAQIEERCDEILAQGFVEEVRRLEKEGLRDNHSASQAIGYRQCLEYLQSAQSEDDWTQFVSSFKKASRRYAKRQLTWFRKEPLFRWINLYKNSMEQVMDFIIQDFEQGF
jgi:tRNA dimethylallyltransferase